MTRAPAWAIVLAACAGCAQLPYTSIPNPPAAQTQAVVFDIDGTLTPAVASVFVARDGAAEAVRAYAAKGYQIIYLSTRTGWLSAGIPAWLRKNGFPDGSVHVAQTRDERDHPDAYKTRVLKAFIAQGWRLRYAYGDSSTDFAAYAASGIPKDHVFALRRRGKSECQPGIAAACLAGWTEHLGFVADTVARADDGR